MCNSYQIARERKKAERYTALKKLVDWGDPVLVRPTVAAPVLREDGRAEMMRWGFWRPWSPSINNTRVDKLETPTWKEAFEKRRCLIPVTAFYEYTGPKGNKTAHRFHHWDNEWLMIAGIWEPNEKHGNCFSMLMTDAAGIIVPYHDRMPVVLDEEDAETYLAGEMEYLKPSAVPIAVEDVVSPLKRRPPPPAQGELL